MRFTRFFEQIALSLFSKERPEQFSHGCSFVESNMIKSLMLLFTKEQLSREQQEQFALGHKKGEKHQNIQKIRFFNDLIRVNCSFLGAIHSNHEQITHVALLS